MVFEVYKGRGKQPYRWRARSSNGQITAQSEGYSRKASAKRAVIEFVCSIATATNLRPSSPFGQSVEGRAENLIAEVDN